MADHLFWRQSFHSDSRMWWGRAVGVTLQPIFGRALDSNFDMAASEKCTCPVGSKRSAIIELLIRLAKFIGDDGWKISSIIFDPMTLGSTWQWVCRLFSSGGLYASSRGGRMCWITAKRQLLINKWVISMRLSVRSTNRHLMRWNYALKFECRVSCGFEPNFNRLLWEILWICWNEVDRINATEEIELIPCIFPYSSCCCEPELYQFHFHSF